MRRRTSPKTNSRRSAPPLISRGRTAGGPSSRWLVCRACRVLAEAKSYAERLFVFERIEHLDGELARKALTEAAATEGVEWDEDAVTLVVQERSGYPYFLQHFEQDTWNDAAGPAITLADARVGAAKGRAALYGNTIPRYRSL